MFFNKVHLEKATYPPLLMLFNSIIVLQEESAQRAKEDDERRKEVAAKFQVLSFEAVFWERSKHVVINFFIH